MVETEGLRAPGVATRPPRPGKGNDVNDSTQPRPSSWTRLLRNLAVPVALIAGGLSGCGGSAGVDNGTIIGRVFANASGGSATVTPLANATIVARRNTDIPLVIRTTRTDANGEFVLSNVPTGDYNIGYSARGYETIDTTLGATVNITPVGQVIQVFVEPEGTSVAPDVTLSKLQDEGDSTLILTVVDSISGDPLTNATVTVGAATTSNGGANGVYTLSVPVRASSGGDGAGELPPNRAVLITAEGFDGESVNPPLIRPIAGETVTATIQVAPNQARITGFIRISQFETLYDRSMITVSVDNVPDVFTMPTVDANGFFTILVPASNSITTRQFNLNFTAPNLQPAVVSNVVAPTSFGTRQLTSPVVMNPVTVDLVGTVVTSTGFAPNQLNPFGVPDVVTVSQTGQSGTIVNGAYTIADVPTIAVNTGPSQLDLNVSAFDPNVPSALGNGLQESLNGFAIFPTSDGTANPTFVVPTLATN